MDNNFLMTSKKSGEVFNTQFKEEYHEGDIYYWHLNLNGNMGHHYFVKLVTDAMTGEILSYYSSCN
jgi:hypothetical protein